MKKYRNYKTLREELNLTEYKPEKRKPINPIEAKQILDDAKTKKEAKHQKEIAIIKRARVYYYAALKTTNKNLDLAINLLVMKKLDKKLDEKSDPIFEYKAIEKAIEQLENDKSIKHDEFVQQKSPLQKK